MSKHTSTQPLAHVYDVPYLIQLLPTCAHNLEICAQYNQLEYTENTVSFGVNDAAMIPQSHSEFRSGTTF
jgi:hypothetical protein